MGIAAYNRGTRLLRARIAAEMPRPARPARNARTPVAPRAPLWSVGEWAFCTVTAIRGWYKVTAVNPKDGRIKITGWNTWNPLHNFRKTDMEGRPYS